MTRRTLTLLLSVPFCSTLHQFLLQNVTPWLFQKETVISDIQIFLLSLSWENTMYSVVIVLISERRRGGKGKPTDHKWNPPCFLQSTLSGEGSRSSCNGETAGAEAPSAVGENITASADVRLQDWVCAVPELCKQAKIEERRISVPVFSLSKKDHNHPSVQKCY